MPIITDADIASVVSTGSPSGPPDHTSVQIPSPLLQQPTQASATATQPQAQSVPTVQVIPAPRARGVAMTNPGAIDSDRKSMKASNLFLLSSHGPAGEAPFYSRDDAWIPKDPAKPTGDGIWTNVVETPKGYYDTDGNPIRSEYIIPRARAGQIGAGGPKSIQRVEIIDNAYPEGRREVLFHPDTGKYEAPEGDDIPLPKYTSRYYAGVDSLVMHTKAERDYSSQLLPIYQAYNSRLADINKRTHEINPSTLAPVLSEADAAKERQSVLEQRQAEEALFQGRARYLGNSITQRENGPDTDAAPASKYNNPFNLKPGNTFQRFSKAEDGLTAGRALLNKYLTTGVLNVNGNSTLQEMMHQWAPYGDGGNDPDVYAANIARALNLPEGVNTKIGTLTGRIPEIGRVMLAQEGPASEKHVAAWEKLTGLAHKDGPIIPRAASSALPTNTAQPPAAPKLITGGRDAFKNF